MFLHEKFEFLFGDFCFPLLCFKILFTYSWETHREAEIQAEEKQASCGEPDAGLDPRTPGSRPEPKADTQPLSHLGVPYTLLFCGWKTKVCWNYPGSLLKVQRPGSHPLNWVGSKNLHFNKLLGWFWCRGAGAILWNTKVDRIKTSEWFTWTFHELAPIFTSPHVSPIPLDTMSCLLQHVLSASQPLFFYYYYFFTTQTG